MFWTTDSKTGFYKQYSAISETLRLFHNKVEISKSKKIAVSSPSSRLGAAVPLLVPEILNHLVVGVTQARLVRCFQSEGVHRGKSGQG